MQKLYADVAKALRSNKMAKIKIWPHEEICPNGAEIESLPDETICEVLILSMRPVIWKKTFLIKHGV